MITVAWILLALVCMFGAAVFIGKCIDTRWEEAEQQLQYRTADWSAIDADCKAIQRQVPDAPTRKA